MSANPLVFTRSHIDNVVQNGDALFVWTGGDIHHEDVSFGERVADWNLKIVNTMGKTNLGELVALPTNGRTRRIWMTGKKKVILGEIPGLQEKIVEAYLHLSRGVPYAMEESVYNFVLRNLERITADDYRAIVNAPNSFHEARKRGFIASMSYPRLKSALTVIAKMLRIE